LRQHPCDVYDHSDLCDREQQLALDQLVFKVMIILYIDGFQVYSKSRASVDGIYISLGNMPRALRNQLANIFCVGVVPPGADINECLACYSADFKTLQEGNESKQPRTCHRK
jgi:hypothetical protein